ncbi:sensor histidine kinase [Dokdonia sinensis]|uniref:Sensor histidine kinase n=1 Tax=Dokdonia sinensis TaxID=2479847 RepID=A0A3M0G4M3_9FLAO|nr:histidine kinase [Dokdonia sinensis]RMB57172.1 sensor histidine kinase [Dokdonia sinensis]
MKKLKENIYLVVVFFCVSFSLNAQGIPDRYARSEGPLLTITGTVTDLESQKPVSRVNVEVTGGAYTTTLNDGEFRIRARRGDELVIRHESFETIYYTIKDTQRIQVQVKPNPSEVSYDEEEKESLVQQTPLPKKLSNSFDESMVKALLVYKESATAGVENIATALESVRDDALGIEQRAKAFKVLGDIYTYWKQYDLAVTNYRLSLKNVPSIDVEIALAIAFNNSKNYQESIALFQKLKAKKVTSLQERTIAEGMGNALVATGDYMQAIKNYKIAEKIASQNTNIEAATRLNTKIAEAYELSGTKDKAITYYDDALELSEFQNTEGATRAKVQAADFFSRNKLYDEEIELRKKALNSLTTINSDTINNSDAITPQKQNYKIANAYAAQSKLEEAIPFFEKSISEAAEKEDVIVEKDATRRLSELYRDMGAFDKAATSYERYVALVDEDYARKEQEISQASRFGKDIAEKQNRILSLEKDRELNESRYQLFLQEEELINVRNTRQQLIIGALALVALLLMITAYTMHQSNKQQKFANNVLALRGLRSQMNPHFIFNALNSVNSFIATNDERTANRYLADFSSLMRSVLENSEQDFIPLSNEVELLQKYTMLEHFRFKDKFDYTFTVDENLNLDDFEIPPMLLQPYVENAVWHGLRYKEEKGYLHIHFSQKNEETALVSITDDGVGREKSKALKTENQKKQKSKGMGNIKKRIDILNEMYDDRINVAVSDVFDTGEGTKVILTLKKN